MTGVVCMNYDFAFTLWVGCIVMVMGLFADN